MFNSDNHWHGDPYWDMKQTGGKSLTWTNVHQDLQHHMVPQTKLNQHLPGAVPFAGVLPPNKAGVFPPQFSAVPPTCPVAVGGPMWDGDCSGGSSDEEEIPITVTITITTMVEFNSLDTGRCSGMYGITRPQWVNRTLHKAQWQKYKIYAPLDP